MVRQSELLILEKAAQGVAQCEVSATRVVVDAAFRRIGKSRHGGHKIANVSVNNVNGFKTDFTNGFSIFLLAVVEH